MSAATIEWIFLLTFFACFFFFLIAEAKWLNLRAGASLRSAAIVAAGCGFIGITAGLLLALIIFGAVVFYFWCGEQLSGDNPWMVGAMLASLIGVFITTFIPKLILTRILRLAPPVGITPYAFVSSIAFIAFVFGIPALIIYFLRGL